MNPTDHAAAADGPDKEHGGGRALDGFDPTDSGGKPVRRYSGGVRRSPGLAAGLVPALMVPVWPLPPTAVLHPLPARRDRALGRWKRRSRGIPAAAPFVAKPVRTGAHEGKHTPPWH
ncbi:hypothetical protein EV190_12515 [Actinorugispora endophytica]|uniref:Uncharacterized protein n=1 Tax=Actinorugispora endophytica TaxID=1605990 RepID=A0A4R6UHK7_9ACTN|nr:hypothetical protein EV190_12515 [Actinorugispora endophytica]